MDDRFRSQPAVAAEWRAFGARDAIVFGVGFLLALLLIAPSP